MMIKKKELKDETSLIFNRNGQIYILCIKNDN